MVGENMNKEIEFANTIKFLRSKGVEVKIDSEIYSRPRERFIKKLVIEYKNKMMDDVYLKSRELEKHIDDEMIKLQNATNSN